MGNRTKYKQTEIGKIPEGWEEKILGEEIELCYGKGLPESKRNSGVVPIFGSNGIVGCHNEFLVNGPGIIVGRKGSVGEVKFSKNDFWAIDTTYFVKLKKKGDIYFWYYFLLTLKLNKMNSHSAVPGLNRDNVYGLLKRIPDLKEQKAIAKILSDLDSKIELNLEINKTLESIGQALFKRWFIDFEFPFDFVKGKPNEKGEPYKSSGGEMVDSELGEIPKGWGVGKLKDLINQSKESCNPSMFPDNYFDYYSIASYDEGKKPKKELGKGILSNKFLVKKRSILLCKLNPRFPRCWAVRDIDERHSVCSTEFLVFMPKEGNHYSYVYCSLKSNYIVRLLQSNITGTSSSHQRVRPDDILGADFILPSNDILTQFNQIFIPVIDKINNNLKENQNLSTIRDSLLPRLMSGRIRVK